MRSVVVPQGVGTFAGDGRESWSEIGFHSGTFGASLYKRVMVKDNTQYYPQPK